MLTQNIKSTENRVMLSGEGSENGEKTTIGPISKTATFHVEQGCSTLFSVNFFVVVLHDQNVKLQETSWLHVLWRKCRTLIFNLVPASISHFLTAATNFSCYSSSKKCLLCFLSLALFLVELRWPVTSFLVFSVFLFLYIPNL